MMIRTRTGSHIARTRLRATTVALAGLALAACLTIVSVDEQTTVDVAGDRSYTTGRVELEVG